MVKITQEYYDKTWLGREHLIEKLICREFPLTAISMQLTDLFEEHLKPGYVKYRSAKQTVQKKYLTDSFQLKDAAKAEKFEVEMAALRNVQLEIPLSPIDYDLKKIDSLSPGEIMILRPFFLDKGKKKKTKKGKK